MSQLDRDREPPDPLRMPADQYRRATAATTLQLALPFLTADDVATVDHARDAIDRAQGHALAARRWAEADELGRLGARLVDLIERNATAARAR